MKKCSKCKKTKQESAFNRRGEGLQHWCRDCQHRVAGIGKYSYLHVDVERKNTVNTICYEKLKKLGVDLEKMPFQEWEGSGEIPKYWKPKKEWMLKKKKAKSKT